MPAAPNYRFEDSTLFESHRGFLRFMRKLLNPILKLFFNPNPLIQALHIQSELNTRNAQREELDGFSDPLEIVDAGRLNLERIADRVSGRRRHQPFWIQFRRSTCNRRWRADRGSGGKGVLMPLYEYACKACRHDRFVARAERAAQHAERMDGADGEDRAAPLRHELP